MKASNYGILIILILVGACTQKKGETHPETHEVRLDFKVGSGANIQSFNVYREDKIVSQISASGEDNTTYSYSEINPVTEHPFKLAYIVEPMFMDSANALTAVTLQIFIDNVEKAKTTRPALVYGDLAKLNYHGQ
jgi:hypothetical protein